MPIFKSHTHPKVIETLLQSNKTNGFYSKNESAMNELKYSMKFTLLVL